MHSLLLGLTAAGIVLGAEAARRRSAYAIPISVAIALFALLPARGIARAYADNVAHIRLWDFLCFWLYGQSLAAHLDPYGARSLGSLTLPIAVDDGFRREVLAVGVPYPPWTLALFRPLGLFSDPHRGALLWCGVEGAALLGAIVMIARWRDVSPYRSAAVVALVLLLPPSLETAILAQTIPLALFFLALYLVRIDRVDAGIWLAAAAIVKPFLLLLLLVPLARRKWGQAVASLATLALMSLAGVMLAGPSVLVNYVRESPIARTPGSVLTEEQNVPIVAYLLRWMHVVPANGATLPPSLVAFDLFLLVVGIVVAWFAIERSAALAACSLLTLSLLVYPQSGSHYAVLLALPLFVLWQHPLFAGRRVAFGAIVFALYVLLAMDGGRQTVFALLLVWIVCATACFAGRWLAASSGAERRAVGISAV